MEEAVPEVGDQIDPTITIMKVIMAMAAEDLVAAEEVGDVAAVAAPEGAWTHEDASYAAP